MKLALQLGPQEAAMISECEGVFVVEPMRFLYPSQAKNEAKAKFPQMCHHRCGHRSKKVDR